MKEQLLRRWAHAPWHSWLKEEPQWAGLFAELLSRLPESALRRLIFLARPLVVLPPVCFGRVVRLNQPFLVGANILQLDGALLERSREETLGILAHELAHLCVDARADELENDLAADRLAAEWGFRDELMLALKQDLADDHPRISAISLARSA